MFELISVTGNSDFQTVKELDLLHEGVIYDLVTTSTANTPSDFVVRIGDTEITYTAEPNTSTEFKGRLNVPYGKTIAIKAPVGVTVVGNLMLKDADGVAALTEAQRFIAELPEGAVDNSAPSEVNTYSSSHIEALLESKGGSGAAAATTIVGDLEIWQGGIAEFRITNYDNSHTWTVASSAGTVGRNEDLITVATDETTTLGIATLTVTRNDMVTEFTFEVREASILTPTALSVQDGSVGVLEDPLLTIEAFIAMPAGADRWLSTDWQVARDAAFTDIVYESLSDQQNAFELRVPLGLLFKDRGYFWRARFNGELLGAGPWLDAQGFQTATSFIYIRPPVVTFNNGDLTAVGSRPEISTSAFEVVGGYDDHTKTIYEFREKDTGEIAYYREGTADYRTWLAVPHGTFKTSTAYVLEVSHVGAYYGASEPTVVEFTTATVLYPDPSELMDITRGRGTYGDLAPYGLTTIFKKPSFPIADRIEILGWEHDSNTEAVFTTPGTHQWVCPEGVTSVNVVCIGGGGSGLGGSDQSGGGGGLGWKNNIPVVPGETYTVVVGAGGITVNDHRSMGGDSYFISAFTVAGNGGGSDYPGSGRRGGSYFGDGGGNGGTASKYQGGGAGGYLGYGGGVSSTAATGGLPIHAQGGGGDYDYYMVSSPIRPGGGVCLNGLGLTGRYGWEKTGSSSQSFPVDQRTAVTSSGANWSACGGGGAGAHAGADGGVRIVWTPGSSFPYNAGIKSRLVEERNGFCYFSYRADNSDTFNAAVLTKEGRAVGSMTSSDLRSTPIFLKTRANDGALYKDVSFGTTYNTSYSSNENTNLLFKIDPLSCDVIIYNGTGATIDLEFDLIDPLGMVLIFSDVNSSPYIWTKPMSTVLRNMTVPTGTVSGSLVGETTLRLGPELSAEGRQYFAIALSMSASGNGLLGHKKFHGDGKFVTRFLDLEEETSLIMIYSGYHNDYLLSDLDRYINHHGGSALSANAVFRGMGSSAWASSSTVSTDGSSLTIYGTAGGLNNTGITNDILYFRKSRLPPSADKPYFDTDTLGSKGSGFSFRLGFRPTTLFYRDTTGSQYLHLRSPTHGNNVNYLDGRIETLSSIHLTDSDGSGYGHNGIDSKVRCWGFRDAMGFHSSADFRCLNSVLDTVPARHYLGVKPELWIRYSGSDGVYTLCYMDGQTPRYLDLTSNTKELTELIRPMPEINETHILTKPIGSDSEWFGSGDWGRTFTFAMFASYPGISKIGKFIGNGTTQVIDCGFETSARFVLICRLDAPMGRLIWDYERGIIEGAEPVLDISSNGPETNNSNMVDPDPTGFRVNYDSFIGMNYLDGEFIYMAIA